MLKGKLVVGQSGGPTCVINNSLVGVIEEAKRRREVTGVLGSLRGISGVLQDRLIDLARESRRRWILLRRTPGSALGTVRYKLQPEDYARIVEVFRAHDVRFFCYIGGNDSMDTAHKVHLAAQELGYDLCSIGVPKTVDNDLAHTDHCPGYGSAARFVALAVRDSGWDTEAMGPSSPVKIVEVMGRNAGWLTAAAALGRQEAGRSAALDLCARASGRGRGVGARRGARCGGAGALCDRAQRGRGAGHGAGRGGRLWAPDEGRRGRLCGGLAAGQAGAQGADGQAQLFAALVFARACPRWTPTRPIAPGARRCGLRCRGKSDVMVTLERQPGEVYRSETGSAPLGEIANAEKLLPDAYISAEGNDVTEAFVDYARPLIGGALPAIGRLSRYPVTR